MSLSSATQSWPNRPVKLIVPRRSRSSGADIAARLLAEHLAPLWDQVVVVENRPGGDSAVAINTLLRRKTITCCFMRPHRSRRMFFQHDKPAYDIAALMPVGKGLHYNDRLHC